MAASYVIDFTPGWSFGGLQPYNSPSDPIYLNNKVNWLDPTNTSIQLDGKPSKYDVLDGTAGVLGVPSVTAGQFMDFTILHELSHYNGAIGNPDKPNSPV